MNFLKRSQLTHSGHRPERIRGRKTDIGEVTKSTYCCPSQNAANAHLFFKSSSGCG
jgi:hypothetical protein